MILDVSGLLIPMVTTKVVTSIHPYLSAKGKGNKDECNNYRGFSLLSVPGKIHGKILTERLMQVIEKKVSDEQGGFRRGRAVWIKYLQLKC